MCEPASRSRKPLFASHYFSAIFSHFYESLIVNSPINNESILLKLYACSLQVLLAIYRETGSRDMHRCRSSVNSVTMLKYDIIYNKMFN